MKTLIRNCIYQGKNAIRDSEFLFWSLVFPIVLVSLFSIAFGGMMNEETRMVNVGIERENPIFHILKEIDIINLVEVSKDDVGEVLRGEQIDGFVDQDLNILVGQSGINQTIIKEIIEQIKQMQALNQPMESYDFGINYIKTSNQEANAILITFYSLIAMLSTYGTFVGIVAVSLVQGNLTYIGAKLNMTPLKKINFLLAGIIVAFTLNILSNGVLLLFIKFILKIDLFIEVKYSLLMILLGNLFGVSLGIFIGASNKKSMEAKTMFSIIITLFLSFLSGMMSTDVKTSLDQRIPILGKINPIAIITNNLYRINFLGNTKEVYSALGILTLYSMVLVLASYLFLRRRSYDSL